MSSTGTYYQFNLDFNNNYIRGYMVSTLPQDYFFTIANPTYSNKYLSDSIKPINDKINLAKSAVVCYFEISEN